LGCGGPDDLEVGCTFSNNLISLPDQARRRSNFLYDYDVHIAINRRGAPHSYAKLCLNKRQFEQLLQFAEEL